MDLQSIDFTATIEISLASTGISFVVHKDLICSKSAFIKRCFEGGFTESKRNTVVINECSDETSMRRLLAWIYGGIKRVQMPNHQNGTTTQSSEFHTAMTTLYLLADRLIMPDLKNDLTDQYRALFVSGEHCNMVALQTLHKEGPEDCHLKTLMLDRLANTFSTSTRTSRPGDLMRQPWFPKLKGLSNNTSDIGVLLWRTVLDHYALGRHPVIKTGTCEYHDHMDGKRSCEETSAP